MSYSLILRPRSSAPIGEHNFRKQLVAGGLTARTDSPSARWLSDDCALFEIVANPTSGPEAVRVEIPYQCDFKDFTRELLNLERISFFLNAELFDGDEVLVNVGKEGLASLLALHARYERASGGHIAGA